MRKYTMQMGTCFCEIRLPFLNPQPGEVLTYRLRFREHAFTFGPTRAGCLISTRVSYSPGIFELSEVLTTPQAVRNSQRSACIFFLKAERWSPASKILLRSRRKTHMGSHIRFQAFYMIRLEKS